MGCDDTILEDINPYPSHDAEGWSESPAGRQTLARVLDQASDGVAAFDQETERRRRPWLAAAAAAVVVAVAVAIPAVILGRSSQGDAPGSGGAASIDGVWILDSLIVDGEFIVVDVGVNSATLPTIEIGATTVGNTGCNDFSVYGDGFTLDDRPLVLGEVVVNAALCDDEDNKGLMFTPSVFREAMRDPAGILVSTVDGTMQWLVDGSTLLFFVRDDQGIELMPEETRQVRVWVNMLGLAQFHPVVWRDRFDRMCGEGVWSPDVALALSSKFIATDLGAGASVRGAGLGLPSPQDGAVALWSMAVNTCRDRFPEGAIEQGPPAFGD